MEMEIHINRLCIHAFHGVLPQERTVGANFYVTLSATVDTDEEAIRQNCLEGTVSYAEMAEVIRREMSEPSLLLENVALRIGKRLLHDFPRIKFLNLQIDKENPPIGELAEGIGVSISLPQ